MNSPQPRRDDAAFRSIMLPVAIQLLGCEPNERLSTEQEARFGSRGAFSVDKVKGTWCDHSDGDRGGGVLDLLKAKKGLEKLEALKWLREQKHLPENNNSGGSFKIAATYDYRNLCGEIICQVCRLDPKDFRQRRPDGNGGWTWKTAGLNLPLYQLPEVVAAVTAGRTIYVAEGEKGVLALCKLGVAATCSPGGAGKWKPHQSPTLTGADVVLLPDNDEPGRQHVERLQRRCTVLPSV